MTIRPERLLAGQQVAVKIIAKMIAKMGSKGREALEPEIDVDDSIPAYLPDGTRIGKVKRTKAAMSARVTDPDALFKWVKRHRPESITESVTDEFVAHVLKRCKELGAPVLADGSLVPGVELTEGSASYFPEPYDDATDAVMRYVAELGLNAALAIEPGDTHETREVSGVGVDHGRAGIDGPDAAA